MALSHQPGGRCQECPKAHDLLLFDSSLVFTLQGPDPTHFPGGFTVALQEELAQDAALHKGQPADAAWMNNLDA